MRAKEFINENTNVFDITVPSIPGASYIANLERPYDLYRFGIDLAVANSEKTRETEINPAGTSSVMLAFTDAENDIIEKTAKKQNLKQIKTNNGKSAEHSDVYTKSPVAKFVPTKRPKR